MATIEPADVIRIIGQYLKENNLFRTLESLQDETSVSLNTVDSIDTFVNDINSGNWDVVLKVVKILKLPDIKLMDLYEQIAIELIELREIRAAKLLIEKTEPLLKLKSAHPEKYSQLRNLLTVSFFDPKEVYRRDGSSKKQRRAAIANELKKEVTVVPAQRLLNLISDALKWQKHEGLLPSSTTINIFTGKAHMEHAEEETFPNVLHKHCVKAIKNIAGDDDSAQIFVCCAEFSPDGHYIVVGYSTGLIEVRNPTTGRLANDLKYQALKSFMVTPSKSAALSLCFYSEELVAVGDKEGDISLWKMSTGEFVQLFKKAHTKAVDCLLFMRNGKEILSGGHDKSVKLHGRQSNKTIRDFIGHQSFVKALAHSRDETSIVSGGDDSRVKIWNAKTAQLLYDYKSPDRVHTIALMPNLKSDIFLIGNRTRNLHLIDLSGKLRTSLSYDLEVEDANKPSTLKDLKEEQQATQFYSACTSPKGGWVYTIDARQIYCFNYSAKKVQKKVLAIDDEQKKLLAIDVQNNRLIGVKHHPFLNLLATYDAQGNLKLWKP